LGGEDDAAELGEHVGERRGGLGLVPGVERRFRS
jgi:hypothetical protein